MPASRQGIGLGLSLEAVVIVPFLGIDVGYSKFRARVSIGTLGSETLYYAGIVILPSENRTWKPYIGTGAGSGESGEGHGVVELGLERNINSYAQLKTGIVAFIVEDADFCPPSL